MWPAKKQSTKRRALLSALQNPTCDWHLNMKVETSLKWNEMLLSFLFLANSLSRGIPHLEPFRYLGLLTSSFYNLKIKSHLFPVTVPVKYVNKGPWYLFQKCHWNHWSVQTSTSCQWTFSKLSFVPKHLQWSRSIHWSQRQN